MKRIVFLLFTVLLTLPIAAQDKKPTPEEMQVEIAQLKLQLAKLSAQDHLCQVQAVLYEKHLGITDQRSADAQAIRQAEDELRKASASAEETPKGTPGAQK